MAKTEDIWNEVLSILNTAKLSGSLTYVKEISAGVRSDIPLFPAIILEPARLGEVNHTVPRFIRATFEITITGWIEVYSPDKQIIGEENDKGILDLERDIKNELEKYPDLNGKCQKFSFPTTSYSFEMYPYRSVEITMAIEYISEATNR